MERIRRVTYFLAGAVSLITLGVYLSSLQNQFVNWDDGRYVIGNTHIRSLNLTFFRWAFLDFYAANWHPLTWLSHAIDYALWGLNPLGHHLTNVILHALNTFVVVLLAARLIEASEFHTLPKQYLSGRFALITAGVTGLLFGLHPLHVESVAWVAERKDLLCGLFFLLSIATYIDYVDSSITPPSPSYHKRGWRSRGCYFFSLGYFTLALLSKPMAVSLPAVLMILDWYPFKRIHSIKTFGIILFEKLPFLLLSLASSMVTLMAQKTGGALASFEVRPLPSRVLVAVKSLIAYLEKIILPLKLIPYYSYPRDVSPLAAEFIMPIALVVAITLVCLLFAKKHRLLLAVWGCYVITLLPVIGIVQVGDQAMADRYTYLPSLGPFLAIGLLAAGIHLKAAGRWRLPARIGGAVTAVALLVLMSYATVKQIGVWKNSLALWNYTIQEEPLSPPIVYKNLGLALMDEGRIDEAIVIFQTVLSKTPYYVKALNGLGLAYEKAGLLEKAVAQYQIVVNLTPDDAKARYTLGLALFQKGSMQKAIDQFEAALKLNPDDAEVQYTAGCAYGEAGLLDDAIKHLQLAIRIQPDHAFAHYNLGIAYRGKGLLDMAIEHLEIAVRLRPSDPGFRNELAKTYALRKMGR